MLNILLEASPLKNGVPTTVRMSSAAVRSDGTQVDGAEWLPVITTWPDLAFGISSGGGAASAMSISTGSVGFRIGKRYANEDWNTYSWVGQPVTCWIGEAGKPLSSYRQFFSGSLSGLGRTGASFELALRTAEGQLDTELLSKRYAGTGGSEGPVGKKGTLKPYCIGDARFVTPVAVDPALRTYQVHGYGPVTGIPMLYEFGQALQPAIGDATTYQAMVDAPLKPGEWVTCNALGMFRLGGRADKLLVADVVGAQHDGVTPTLVGDIIPMLLQEAGVSPQRIGDMSALDFTWSFYTTEQITVAELVKQAALEAGAYVFPDRNRVWQCGRHRGTKPAVDIRKDRTSEPLLRVIDELNVTDPTWRVEVGYDRCWTVHSEGDISPKLVELEGKLNARDEVLDALIGEAEEAAADAAFARIEMGAMVANGILDRLEKQRAITHLERERLRHRRLEGVYQAYKVQAQWDAYDAAWLAAEAYMLALSPSIYDDAINTPVIAADYLGAWATYDAALKLLFDTIIGRTVGVPGKAPIGGVIQPDGTIVGGRPADDVLDDVDASKNAWKTLPDRLGQLIQKPIDDLAAVQIGYGAGLQKSQQALHKKNLVAIRTLETRVEDNEKIAEDILQLTSRLDEAELALAGLDIEGSIEAGLLEIRQTIANLDFAEASEIDQKIANYGEGVSAWQNEEERVRAEQDNILAEDIDELGGRITTEVDDVKTTLEGQINDVRQIILDSESNTALALRIDEMGVRITEEVGDERLAREAAIQTIEETIADGDRAQAERIDTLSSSVTDLTKDGGTIANINAVIQTIQQTEADNNGARALETTNLQSRLDNLNGTAGASLEQMFQTYADKVDGVGAQYVLKVQTDVNGQQYIAGMGVAIENGVSAITFSTDSFRISTPGANPQQVFYADAEGVYMPNVRVGKITYDAMDDQFILNSQINSDSGYQELPGGILLQWGKVRGFFGGGLFPITFPKPFSEAVFTTQATPFVNFHNTSDQDAWIHLVGNTMSLTGVSIAIRAGPSGQSLNGFDWWAVGK